MMYGKELIIDLYKCDVSKFTKENLTRFFIKLVDDILKMEREDLHFWAYETQEEKDAAPDHLNGTSAIQFISTSNVTIHVLDNVGEVYLNIFSCADYDSVEAYSFCMKFFGSTSPYNEIYTVYRGRRTQCSTSL